MTSFARSLVVLLAAAGAPAAFADSSLRCPGGIVSVGDAAIDLLARCGPPALRDRRVDEQWVVTEATGEVRTVRGRPTEALRTAVGRRVTVVIDEWSYDFGPSAFTYVIRLENGRIQDFTRGDYGRRDGPPDRPIPPRARCEENTVHEGDTKLDVLSRCGEPAVRDAWDELQGRVELWTFDHGRDRFVRYIRIVNGRVVKVTTGSYGYAD